jgi:translation initiation factor eIF-2B subunit alpha
MSQIDCVFTGADCVLENGGIVNRIGTYTAALCAKSYNKPFYVFVESLKFFKRFPLHQSDIFSFLADDEGLRDISKADIDYTSPEYISEIFTDIGIFTPPAVSDELIKFFQ